MLIKNLEYYALEVDEYQDLPIDIRKGGVVVALEQYCIWDSFRENCPTIKML